MLKSAGRTQARSVLSAGSIPEFCHIGPSARRPSVLTPLYCTVQNKTDRRARTTATRHTSETGFLLLFDLRVVINYYPLSSQSTDLHKSKSTRTYLHIHNIMY